MVREADTHRPSSASAGQRAPNAAPPPLGAWREVAVASGRVDEMARVRRCSHRSDCCQALHIGDRHALRSGLIGALRLERFES